VLQQLLQMPLALPQQQQLPHGLLPVLLQLPLHPFCAVAIAAPHLLVLAMQLCSSHLPQLPRHVIAQM
jgi:hypothetical protein